MVIGYHICPILSGARLWQTIVSTVWPRRNAIVHSGAAATEGDAVQAIECANALLDDVVKVVATNLGFTLETTGAWSRIRGESGSPETGDWRSWSQSYDPKSPFDDNPAP